jgi:hypothetical protein
VTVDLAIAPTGKTGSTTVELATRTEAAAGPALMVAERTTLLLAALEQTRDLGEVVTLEQQAGALSGLARAARVGLEQQNGLAAARVRIQHRAGVLLQTLANDHRPGRAKHARGKAPLRPQLPAGVLHEHGISGAESSRWQAMASLPIEDVLRRLDELMAANLEVTTAEFYRRGRASLRKDRNSQVGATPVELRLRAALTNLRRVSGLSTPAEWGLARKIADCLREWQPRHEHQREEQRRPRQEHQLQAEQYLPSRTDMPEVVVSCLLCGRDRPSALARRCACGGSWTTALG